MSDRTSLIKEITSHITDLKSQFRRLDTEFVLQKHLRSELESRKRAALKSLADALLILKVVDTVTLANRIGFPSLPLEVDKINKRFANWQSEIKQIEANPDFQNAVDLIDPITGNLTLEKEEQLGYLATSKANIAKFQDYTNFNKLYVIIKKGGINPTNSWWTYLWQVFTGKLYQFKKLKKSVLKYYGYVSIDALAERYEILFQDANSFQNSVNQLNQRIHDIQENQLQHAKRTAQFANRESTMLVEVYEKVLTHLSSVQDFTQIRSSLGSEYSIITGTIIALGQQISLMSTSVDGLRAEIADRETAINQLTTLKLKLSTIRKSTFKGDISSKLNLAVRNRHNRTDRYLATSNGYAARIYSYNNYDTFDHQLSSISDELNTLNLLACLIQIESQDDLSIESLSEDSSNMFGDTESTTYDPTSLEIPIDDFAALSIEFDFQSIIDEMQIDSTPSHSGSSDFGGIDLGSNNQQDTNSYEPVSVESYSIDTSSNYE